MIAWTRERLKYLGVRLLQMLESPQMELTPAKEAAFEALWTAHSTGGAIAYDLPYPKYEFLRYLVQTKAVLLHGTNWANVVRLEPRRQTTFLGRPTEAVFATPDAIWCIFYAIVNGKGFHGSKRNICLRVTGPGRAVRKFYWFSLAQPMLERSEPFCTGMVYILPRQTFTEGDIADEWTSSETVVPVAKLPLQPDDFPFLAEIRGHSEAESTLRFYGRMLWPRRPA